MLYMGTFMDKKGNVFKQSFKTVCIELAHVSANLVAYRNDCKIIKVSKADLLDGIYDAVKTKSCEKVLSAIKKNSVHENTMLEELQYNVKKNGMKYEEMKLPNGPYDFEQWVVLKKHVVTINSNYNVYGLLELKKITIYDETDSILAEKEY